jgi:CHAT domain-containing protein/Tfp pilus assembly protein PilF
MTVGLASGQQVFDEAEEVKALSAQVAKLYQAGKYAEAIPLEQRILGIAEEALGPEHQGVAHSLAWLATLYQATGQYAKAEPLYQRSLAITEKALGPEHPDVATSLNNLAHLYHAMGDYAKAELLHRRSLGIYEKALDPDHSHVAVSLSNLAKLYETTGQYARAEPLYQRSLAIKEKALGPDHPDVATSLNNLALMYTVTGNYAKAEPFFQRALAITEKALGPDHPRMAVPLNNLAGLYLAIHLYAKAELLFQRALAIDEKALGPDHPEVAVCLNNLAELYRTIGAYVKAEPLSQRALLIREKALGPDHPDVAGSLYSLAVLYSYAGAYAKAEPLSQQALLIREKALGPDHPDVANSLSILATLYQATGQYAKAEPLYQRSLAIKEKALGPDHPDVAIALSSLGALAAAQQHYQSTISFFKRGLGIEDRHIQNVFAITTEKQKLTFMESISGAYLAFLSLIHQHFREDRVVVREGLELVLRRKGIVFDALSRAREALPSRLSEAARKEWEQLSAFRGELSQLLLNKPKAMTLEQYQANLVSLQQRIEQSEQRLAKGSALVAKELQQRKFTVAAISKTLPKDAALVDFVKILDYDFVQGQWKPSMRYLAFVLTSEGDVNLVDLGEASALEAIAQRALADIKTSLGTRGIEILKAPCDRSVDPRGIEIQKAPCGRDAGRQSVQLLQELYAQVWAPMEKALGKADKVVLSPDGLLNLVPFAALVDSQGRSLVERYQLAYVTSGRELVGVEGAMPRPDSDLLLVANPSFDQKGSDAGRQGAALRSREFRGVFTPLPGTERESREIPPLVVAPKEQKQVLVGKRATETAVKNARSPRILHLATHGFFLPDDESALDAVKLGGVPDRGITVVPRPIGKRYENPLVRSGLAFAGANHATGITDGDDGILTALEITGMDLYGTELVVLSACDTGVGEIKTGEGVFGLRRAFALAGAKNLLMSLWEVSDDVTARQMKMFYQNLQKLPKAEALRQAQLETIKELKAEYNGLAPPGLWAPFILQGAQALGQ